MRLKLLILLTLIISVTGWGYHDLVEWASSSMVFESLLILPVLIAGSIFYCVLTSKKDPDKETEK